MLQKILLYCLCLFFCSQLSAQTLLTAFKNEQGKWGFKEEESGKVVIAPQFTEARRISFGYAAVRKNGKWGYIDKQGKLIHDYQFDKAGNFSFERLAIVKRGGEWFKITPEKSGGGMNVLGKAYEEDLEREYNREENQFDPDKWWSLDEEDGMYNAKKAFRTALEGAQNGDLEMIILVADKYLRGEGVQKNEVESFQWYKKAAAKGDDYSKYIVGLMHLEGVGTPKNIPEGFSIIKKESGNGNINAMHQLGVLYIQGIGTAKNPPEALSLFKKSAEKGNSNSMVALGDLYSLDFGIQNDLPLAFAWYKKAADKQNIVGEYMTGRFLAVGMGTIKNSTDAIKYLQRAANYYADDPEYYNILAYCYYDQGNFKRAMELLKTALTKDPKYANGFDSMAEMYMGIGNRTKAIEYYRKAAGMGNKNSIDWLKKNNINPTEENNTKTAGQLKGTEKLNYYNNGKLQSIGKEYNGKRVGEWQFYFSGGSLDGIFNYDDEERLHGKYELYFTNGKLREAGTYVNNKIEGTISFYHPNGKLSGKQNFKDGKHVSDGDYFDENGNITLQNGTGYRVEYFVNGKFSFTGNFKNGKKQSRCTWYFDNGNLKEESNYDNGIANGEYKIHFESGKLKEKGVYENGKVNGLVGFYHPNGNFFGSAKYSNGTLISRDDFFDENGNLILTNGSGVYSEYNVKGRVVYRCNYLNYCRNGIAQWYHDNGQLEQEAVYKFSEAHKPDGLRWEIISSFDNNGQQREKGTLKNGTGTWITYDANGNKTVNEYVNGIKK